MSNSGQSKSIDDCVCLDYFQGRWRVSIGDHILCEIKEKTKAFHFAGKLAEEKGLGVALYQTKTLKN